MCIEMPLHYEKICFLISIGRGKNKMYVRKWLEIMNEDVYNLKKGGERVC